MSDNGLPCIDLLEATPTILRGLMAELDDEDVRWKPAPDRFSVGEVLAHLSESEGHCYRARLDQFMSEDNPEFEPDDAQFHLAEYAKADPEDSFDHFEEQRETNIEFLRATKRLARSRSSRCFTSGPCTISGTFARSRSWSAPANISPAPGRSESPIN
jgi:DinB superfamily